MPVTIHVKQLDVTATIHVPATTACEDLWSTIQVDKSFIDAPFGLDVKEGAVMHCEVPGGLSLMPYAELHSSGTTLEELEGEEITIMLPEPATPATVELRVLAADYTAMEAIKVSRACTASKVRTVLAAAYDEPFARSAVPLVPARSGGWCALARLDHEQWAEHELMLAANGRIAATAAFLRPPCVEKLEHMAIKMVDVATAPAAAGETTPAPAAAEAQGMEAEVEAAAATAEGTHIAQFQANMREKLEKQITKYGATTAGCPESFAEVKTMLAGMADDGDGYAIFSKTIGESKWQKGRFECTLCKDKTHQIDDAHGDTLRHFGSVEHVNVWVASHPGAAEPMASADSIDACLPSAYSGKRRRLTTAQHTHTQGKRARRQAHNTAVAVLAGAHASPVPAPHGLAGPVTPAGPVTLAGAAAFNAAAFGAAIAGGAAAP